MAVTTAGRTVVGVYSELRDAEDAVRELQNHGFSRDDISVVANRNRAENKDVGENYPDIETGTSGHETKLDKGADIAGDAGLGAALGGLGGLLAGFAGLLIPGVGPILAAGPIVFGLAGMGIGAAAGGIIGALVEAGVPKEEAHHYAEGIRRGDVLVTVKASDEDRAELARDILDRHQTVDVEDRVSGWRARGWQGYDPGAAPLSADELKREREYYGLSRQQGDEWQNLTERERAGADEALQGETRWPHKVAHDTAESLESEDVLRAEQSPDIAADNRDFKNSNRQWGASIENNLRVTDPAIAQAESGFQRAMESASRSAKRRARIYSR